MADEIRMCASKVRFMKSNCMLTMSAKSFPSLNSSQDVNTTRGSNVTNVTKKKGKLCTVVLVVII